MISNSLGSNVYNNLICLGLPWFIFSFIRGSVQLDGTGLLIYTCLVLATLLAVILIIVGSRFVLTRQAAVMIVVVYLVFIMWAALFSFPTGHPVLDLSKLPPMVF